MTNKTHARRTAGSAHLGVLALVTFGSSFIPSSSTRQAPTNAAKLAPYVEALPNSLVKIQMVPIPGGKITIRGKVVEVKPFYMAKTETPWEAYDAFTASGPASVAYDQTAFAPDAIARPSKSYILPDLGWGHKGFPCINVSFTSVDMFARYVASVSNKKYRLPTEAEWELACRADVLGAWKLDKASIDKAAWYKGNSDGLTKAVGTKSPNKYGLHDMLGNVGEWATDLDGKPILCGGTFLDSLVAINPTTRRRWAPAWQATDPQLPKSRWWLSDAPFAGFRLVCEP
ncbi:MAG: formylglycine-generating enzyme family protein [Fimbriimonas sp.]